MGVSAEPDKSEASLKAGAEPEGVRVLERWHSKRDGTIFPVETSAGPFVLNERNVVYSNIRGITQRKRAEEAIRESEEKYRMLADDMDDVIWQLILDILVTYVSPSVEGLPV